MDSADASEVEPSTDVDLLPSVTGDELYKDPRLRTSSSPSSRAFFPGDSSTVHHQITANPLLPSNNPFSSYFHPALQSHILDPSWPRAGKRPALSPISDLSTQPAGASPDSGGSQALLLRAEYRGGGATTNPVVGKSGKKRSRASRRAPTTVLTTDTTNFRQMVQEFTGIPSPPFASTSSFSRTSSLDLFASTGTGVPLPSFLLSPFSQKPQILSTSSNHSSLPSTSRSPANSAFDLRQDSRFSNLPATYFPNTLFSTHPSLLSPTLKFNFPNILPERPLSAPPMPTPTPPMSAQRKVSGGVPGEFSGDQSQVGPDSSHMSSSMSTICASSILSSPQSRLVMSRNSVIERRDQPCSRPSDRDDASRKMNYSSSSADFYVELGSSERMTEGEGVNESWICSPD